MSTLQAKVDAAIESKTACKNALLSKMQAITDETPLDDYADKVNHIGLVGKVLTDGNIVTGIDYEFEMPAVISNTAPTGLVLTARTASMHPTPWTNYILKQFKSLSLPDSCLIFNPGSNPPPICKNAVNININKIEQQWLPGLYGIFQNFNYYRWAGTEISTTADFKFPWSHPRDGATIDLPEVSVLNFTTENLCDNVDNVNNYTVYLPKIGKITHTVNTGGLIGIPSIHFGGDLESIDAVTADVLRANGASSNSIPKGKTRTKITFDNNNIPYTQREI